VPAYQKRFRPEAEVKNYDLQEYAPDSYSSFIWELEKPWLSSILQCQKSKLGSVSLLDFACGTGRILSFAEQFVDSSDGVEVSAAMLERAADVCQTSRLLFGNIIEDAALAHRRYDVITAFRFLLNAEDPLRRAALQALRERIDDGHGLLVANVHGHSFSLRHLALACRRWRNARGPASDCGGSVMLNELSFAEIAALFRDTGFEIESYYGFGIFPQFVYRTPAASLAKSIDRLSAGRRWARKFSIDLMFVCRPVPLVKRQSTRSDLIL
jgi:SAM-dependent methyltransferase